MKVGVLGDSSSLGKALKLKLVQKGHDVYSWNRNQTNIELQEFFFSIDKYSSEIDLPELDWLILLAWKQSPRNKSTATQNIYSISNVVRKAKLQNIRIVFISTLGAISNSKSWHVISKQHIESELDSNDVVIRPGSIQNDYGQLLGNISWIEKFNLPVKIRVNPPLYVSKVNQSLVIENCIQHLENENPVISSENNPVIRNLVSDVEPLKFGLSSSRLRIILDQKVLNFIFMVLGKSKITILVDLSDKWSALMSVQDFNRQLISKNDELGKFGI